MRLNWLVFFLVLLSGCASFEVTHVEQEKGSKSYMVEWKTPYGYVYQQMDYKSAGGGVYCVGHTEWLPLNSLFVRLASKDAIPVSPFTDREGYVKWIDRMPEYKCKPTRQ